MAIFNIIGLFWHCIRHSISILHTRGQNTSWTGQAILDQDFPGNVLFLRRHGRLILFFCMPLFCDEYRL